MKVRIKLTENHIFIGLVCLIFAAGAYTIIKNPTKTSRSENRSLVQFQHFTIKSFLSGSFQSNFENALSDQFPKSEKIRTVYGESINKLPKFGLDTIACANRYIIIDSRQNTNAVFNCDDFLIAPPMTEDPRQKQNLEISTITDDIEKYNHINSLIDTYYYFIEEPQSFNFATGERVLDLETALRSQLTGHYSMASLQFNTYEEYKKYYYKTDHHWNYVGQYQGYQDITKLLGIDNPRQPVELVTNHEYYFGSRARDSRNYDIEEEFAYYRFDLPDHDTYVNGTQTTYGHHSDYSEHNYTAYRTFNHYSYVFGGDFGEVVFDYHQPDKENLLIISNSFDNPVNQLIAQYYNRTFAVDPRHYQKDLGENFRLSDYIKSNRINKVLLIIQPRFIFNKNSNKGLEL